ncbi:unnamed protein product [Taenia asiatica]|uniref:Coiled-coil domain-containing protein 170 n=1 Tax=Taenia asiatica TaxID=60517 RepID=A0A0R3W910_TAEAS|nr:unnamed protein product [Taenia asiatica]
MGKYSDLSGDNLNNLIAIEKNRQKPFSLDSTGLSLREKVEQVEENLRDSLSQIVDQQQTIRRLTVDRECAVQKASEMDEKFKGVVEWMQVIITSTKSALAAQEEIDFSDEAVQRLKTKPIGSYKIAASITLSRQNAVRIGELQSNLAAKDAQISHLKSVIAKLGSSFRRSTGTGEEPKSENTTCCSLQSQVAELISRLAASEGRVEKMEEECLKMRAKRSRSPPKSVGFLPCTTDLEDSHERLLQFLKQLGNRIPVDQAVFEQMSVTDQRDFILNYVEKLSAPSPVKSESELAPKLHKRVQRLQDELMSRDLQLKTWRRKVDKLEEQLMISKKNEAEATEKHVFAEQRAAQLRRNEIEAKKLNNEVLQLRNQLKDSKDAKDRLEEKTMRVAELEGSLRDLEKIRQQQANRIEELTTTLEMEKAAMTRNLVQQTQHAHFNKDSNDASQSLEESTKETQELRDFRDIVGRLLGMRVNDLPEPNKTILHRVERLLKESGRNSLNQSTSLCHRSVSPRRGLHGYSARIGSTHG